VVAEQFEQSPSLSEDQVAGDYVPHLPSRDEVPDAWADAVLPFLADVSAEEASHDAQLGARAIDLLAGPAVGGREPVDVVITHAFTIGWLVRDALGAPAWRCFPRTSATLA
jgi:probable phosphoglycerate mutase